MLCMSHAGTTWVEEMAYLVLHGGDITKSTSSPCYMRCLQLEDSRAIGLLKSEPSPRFFKTHLPFHMLPNQVKQKGTKVLHIVRNPKDVAVSYYHFYRALTELGNYSGTWSEFLAMFTAGYVCCGKWTQYIKGWWHSRNMPNILFIKYEELKKDPIPWIQSIARFYGKPLDTEAVNRIAKHTSFESMRANPCTNFHDAPHIDHTISPFMRKGTVGDWKNYFTVAQNESFDKLLKDQLQDTTLTFDYELPSP